jgi:hypothetical protein
MESLLLLAREQYEYTEHDCEGFHLLKYADDDTSAHDIRAHHTTANGIDEGDIDANHVFHSAAYLQPPPKCNYHQWSWSTSTSILDVFNACQALLAEPDYVSGAKSAKPFAHW